MSVAQILRLDEYRDRRAQRVQLSEALCRVDPRRHAIFRHLSEIATLSGADRIATVWVDEYGAGSIHPHLVLDQLCDPPRRGFSHRPLREAWELGVPSALDRPAEPAWAIPTTFAVSLGSDGTRAWFLVAESVTARPLLGEDVRDRIMFLSGECSAVVLHRDLRTPAEGAEADEPRFAGWPILADLDGRESDEAAGRRVAQRFVVGRLVRMLVDDELISSPERIAEQVRRARSELVACRGSGGDEEDLWHRVLDALYDRNLEELAEALVELGDAVEAQAHANGALELYGCAYDIAAALGSPGQAAEAARLSGRLLRRQARWDDADRWFRTAQEIAELAGLHDLVARAMVGLAGIKRETGNFPAARAGFREALAVAEKSGERDVVGFVHHALLGLEHQAGDLLAAMEHGWIALASYESDVERTRCMAGLAGALIEYGDREAAEDAWTLVAHSSKDQYYLVYAHDALGYLAALRGDLAGFEAHARRCDSLDWESGSRSAKAEILYYRGLSYRSLGQSERAAQWLSRAVTFAEEHGYNLVLFKAEAALQALTESLVTEDEDRRTPTPAAPAELREGLRAMRQELVGVGA